MIKLLLDQGTPRSAASMLRAAGWDAVHTGDVGLSEAEDSEIIARSANDGRVVVTMDADFHAQLALSGARQPSVIRIRIAGLRAPEFSQLLQRVLHRCRDDVAAGAMISVTDSQIRVRRLPIA